MTKILGDFKYVLTDCERGIVSTHVSLQRLLLDILTSNGQEFFERFKRTTLVAANEQWELENSDDYFLKEEE